ncbi:hypothetical protein BBJ29_006361 [Phytophthora kernoviae]|uniref:DUF2423 domain-containing protein n=1 Tax=Phytophthora kernoviae TaxID=325452 RepID=A0A3F2RUP5_9STRA|nr:hypothetical protein BBP00_00003361 [Phytophthora kernoviae]RLN68496.1 hypothetical protein BBJ29_006361 [Phytophthora kernoviae]
MAKSLRSKIKRKFRTELRKRIGVPHEAIREAKIQENLKNAIATQGNGKSVASLKKLMGASVPIASSTISGATINAEQNPAEAESALLNQETDAAMAAAKKEKKKKAKKPRRKNKFVHFHELRKKGV